MPRQKKLSEAEKDKTVLFKGKAGPGRPKGSISKVDKKTRAFFALLLEQRKDQINQALDKVYHKDPAEFLRLMFKAAEFSIPKLRAVDHKLDIPPDMDINLVFWKGDQYKQQVREKEAIEIEAKEVE